MSDHQWDHSVPKGAKLIHPIGQPISVATNCGFRTTLVEPFLPSFFVIERWGKRTIASVSVVPVCLPELVL